MTKIRYEAGRLCLLDWDAWGKWRAITITPRDLEPEQKAMLRKAVEEMDRTDDKISEQLSDRLKMQAQLKMIVNTGMDDQTIRSMLADLEDLPCGPVEAIANSERDAGCNKQRVIVI